MTCRDGRAQRPPREALGIAAALVLLLGGFGPAFADQIRGIIVSELTIPSDAAYENTVALTIEEMAVVELAGETPFLTDIRVELHLSNALKKQFDTFALAVYKNVTPAPRRDRRFFEGQRAFLQYLPYLNRIYVLMPLEGSEPPQEPLPVGTYRFDEPVLASEFPLIVTLVPLGKGVPASIAEEKYYLTFRPVLQKKGYAEIDVRFPAGQENQGIRLLVDERDVPYPTPPLELPAGIHQLRVLSERFKEVSTSFAVESGKTARLEVTLEELLSTLRVDAPQGADVFLDGERMADAGEHPVEPGPHMVRIRIGDYSHSKKFTIEPGRHYHLAVIFDIIVNVE
ncbi:MAG: hypothetical protein JW820_01630 [Spirochaetales bacterium]|nr:hypothetical protein [Spirochaetales bacterium]